MMPEGPLLYTPCPYLFFSHSLLLTTYINFMHGWGWQWLEYGGKKANWPSLGGSNGEDDQLDDVLLLVCSGILKNL